MSVSSDHPVSWNNGLPINIDLNNNNRGGMNAHNIGDAERLTSKRVSQEDYFSNLPEKHATAKASKRINSLQIDSNAEGMVKVDTLKAGEQPGANKPCSMDMDGDPNSALMSLGAIARLSEQNVYDENP